MSSKTWDPAVVAMHHRMHLVPADLGESGGGVVGGGGGGGNESDDSSVYYDVESPRTGTSPEFNHIMEIKRTAQEMSRLTMLDTHTQENELVPPPHHHHHHHNNNNNHQPAVHKIVENGVSKDEQEEEEEGEKKKKQQTDEEECCEMILMDQECYEKPKQPQEEEKACPEEEEEGGAAADDEDEEEVEIRRVMLKRSSSLKSSRSKEDSDDCREKKIVRFADVLGLDLADVRTFLDEVPRVPKSAFMDLEGVEVASSSPPIGSPAFFGVFHQQHHLHHGQPHPQEAMSRMTGKTIVPLFRQPNVQSDFNDRLGQCKVCLETAQMTDSSLLAVTGYVRVVNLDYHKSVIIRHTKDRWRTSTDLKGKYVPDSCDGYCDRFKFTIYAHNLNIGDRLEFAIRYDVKGAQYWDNNRGANYAMQVIPEVQQPPPQIESAYVSSSPTIQSWVSGAFF